MLDHPASAFSIADISQRPSRSSRLLTSLDKAWSTSLQHVQIEHTPHPSLARMHFHMRLSHRAFLHPEAQEQVRGLSTPEANLVQSRCRQPRQQIAL